MRTSLLSLILLVPGGLATTALSACGDDGAGSDGSSTSSTGQGGATTSSGSETTVGSTTSSSGVTNTSSSTSSTSSTSTSGAGGCYATFDGADDVLVSPVGAEVGLVDGFSIGAFIDPEPLADGGTAFLAGRHNDGDSNGFYLALVNQGGVYLARLIVFTGSGTCSADGPAPGPGDWQHVLGSFSFPTLRVFVDGQLAGEAECNATSNIDPTSVVTVGRSQTGVFPFGGSMDDVAYYAQPFAAAFDPAQLGCGSSAAMRYSFDNTSIGRQSAVEEDCGTSADAQVGSASGPDASDPQFICP